MPRTAFDERQRRLQDDVLILGGMLKRLCKGPFEVVKKHDFKRSRYLIANRRNISRKCNSIETEILALLATQQPMAGDLRKLATTLEVALELERIGDHAKEIAGVNLKIGEGQPENSLVEISKMARLAGGMLNRSTYLICDTGCQPGASRAHRR